MRKRAHAPVVPAALVADIEVALARVDEARERLDRALRADADLLVRRRAHAEVRNAFTAADAPLREATRLARAHSHREWSRWRHRLSTLDVARQQHLFAEADDSAAVMIASVRVVDTGMSGPAIGEFQHGECSPPGKRATYGLDLEAALLALDDPDPAPASAAGEPAEVVALPAPARAAADHAGAEVA